MKMYAMRTGHTMKSRPCPVVIERWVPVVSRKTHEFERREYEDRVSPGDWRNAVRNAVRFHIHTHGSHQEFRAIY